MEEEAEDLDAALAEIIDPNDFQFEEEYLSNLARRKALRAKFRALINTYCEPDLDMRLESKRFHGLVFVTS